MDTNTLIAELNMGKIIYTKLINRICAKLPQVIINRIIIDDLFEKNI